MEIKGIANNSDEVNFISIKSDNIEIDNNLSVQGNLTVNGEVIGPEPPFTIVDFAMGTDAQIAAMLEKHYSGDIDITNYWHVGDTRIVHINATNSGTINHVTQNMTMVIMGFNHDDLVTPINGKDKAAVTIGFRETMGNNGTAEYEYYWGGAHSPINASDNYSKSPLRTWLNNGLFNALPVTFSSLIKEVNKKNLTQHTSTSGAPLITKDKIWLLSYPEVFGTTTYSNYLNGNSVSNWEGTQYEYLKDISNRIKYINNDGNPRNDAVLYWLRSPLSMYDSTYGYRWGLVYRNGTTNFAHGNEKYSIAPAFCL